MQVSTYGPVPEPLKVPHNVSELGAGLEAMVGVFPVATPFIVVVIVYGVFPSTNVLVHGMVYVVPDRAGVHVPSDAAPVISAEITGAVVC